MSLSVCTGPHNHTITALAVALAQAKTPEFKEYQRNVLENSQSLAKGMQNRGYELVSGGTDNHLCLVNLRNKALTGSKVEYVLERANIALNKNTVPGDKSAMNPGGIRMGSPALTTRGLNQQDFDQVAEFVHRGVTLAREYQEKCGSKKLKDYKQYMEQQGDQLKDLHALKKEVIQFASQFPLAGVDD